MKSEKAISRRRILRMFTALSGFALSGATRSLLARSLEPTAGQIMGPFYPVLKPLDQDADLTVISGKPGRAKGQIIHLMGRVLDLDGKPIPDARIERWQANTYGRYDHPRDPNTAPLDPNFQGYGVQHTDGQGRYRFKTIKPGPYPVSDAWTRTPHIHFDIRSRTDRLVTQMYFPGEPLNEEDQLLQGASDQESLLAKLMPPTEEMEADSRIAVWDIVLGRSSEGGSS